MPSSLSNANTLSAYKYSATSTGETYTATVVTSIAWNSVVACFKPSGGGGLTVIPISQGHMFMLTGT